MSVKHLDVELRRVWGFLVTDLRKVVANTEYPLDAPFKRMNYALASGDMNIVRGCTFPNYMVMPAYYAKAARQAEMFGKRWLFDDDANDDGVVCPGWAREVADAKTAIDFVRTQSAVLQSLPSSPVIDRVLDGAQELCSYILGQYDEEEHKRSCRFGSKASYGIPRSRAYLFNRLKDLSATRRQVKLWGKWIVEDEQLREIMRREIIRARAIGLEKCINLTEHLNLTIVPKKYNVGRVIVPDTVLGGFISNGLGRMIMDRLAVNAGLDIRRKQQEHKRVALKASRTGHLVTADMSKASDNISWALLQRILPKGWIDVIDSDRIRKVSYEGEILDVSSPLLMGKGYTFPLQTLVFYSLLLSIANELGIGHKYISVYGDDLIYPYALHKYVLAVFPKLGLIINVDKTSCDKGNGTAFRKSGCFRESCGGDYLDGMDIRPYAPMGRSDDVSANPFETAKERAMFYYTLLNGLLSRWHWSEIRGTVRHLLICAQNCIGRIVVVPTDSAVTAGLRYDGENLAWLTDIEELLNIEWPKYAKVQRKDTLGGYSEFWLYSFLSRRPQWAEVEDEYIYLWDCLRAKAQDDPEVDGSLAGVLSVKLKFLGVPGYREEVVKELVKQRWDVGPERLRSMERKLYVDKFNRIHERRPLDGPSQVVWHRLPVVDSKDELGTVKIRRGEVPLHLLFTSARR